MWRLICATAALLIIASSAPCQESDAIVVTGIQAETLQRFVKDISDPGQSDQLARWDGHICSGVIGLDAGQARFVNARIGAASALAKLEQGPEGCRPNILVIFTRDAAGLAQGFAKRFPRSLARDGRGRLVRFASSDQPVRWISGSELAPSDGSPLHGSPGEIPTGRLTGSRLITSTRSVLSFMLVIVDSQRIGEVRLGPLADYLAMVAIARPPMASTPPSGSVLSLFRDSNGEPAKGLTDNDRAYLAALYRSAEDRPASVQRGMIARSMRARAGETRDQSTAEKPQPAPPQ